jgi:hypothetical protein
MVLDLLSKPLPLNTIYFMAAADTVQQIACAMVPSVEVDVVMMDW